jgi:CRISPR-associated protein Cmr4
MYDKSKLMFIRATSSLHPGAGDGLGFIDKPIQRQADNHFPKMEGSGIKGVIREAFSSKNKEDNQKDKNAYDKNNSEIAAAFGPLEADDSQKSALNFQDARILFFPVPSAIGNTLYITCPTVLQRLKNEVNRAIPNTLNYTIPNLPTTDDCQNYGGDADSLVCVNQKMLLNTYILNPKKEKSISDLFTWLADRLFDDDSYYHTFFKHRMVVVNDALFTFFVKNRTEVITGNRIDLETGVVKDGHLFTYEYLPEGTVFYTFVEAGPERVKGNNGKKFDEIMKIFEDGITKHPYLKMGGRTSVGKGEVAVKLFNPNPIIP